MITHLPYRHLCLLAWAAVALCLAGCLAAREGADAAVSLPVEPLSPTVSFAGVDSLVARAAAALAESSFVDRRRQEQAARLAGEGRALVAEADSLLPFDEERAFLKEPAGPDTTSATTKEAAVEAFNRGARALKRFAGADSAQAAALLEQAQDHFEQALWLNPFDAEARYWLSRVYHLRASRLGAASEHEKALEVLQRLVWMHQDEHGLFASLATTHEHLGRWKQAAALWQRAVRTARDDERLDPDGRHRADSSLLLSYYVRSERAFVQAGYSEAALQALLEADPWARTAADRALVAGERAWILWDDGNLETRKRWDELLSLREPAEAIKGLEVLLIQVASRQARGEVRHRLGLLYYESGERDRAADTLQALWHDLRPVADSAIAALAERVREDYGTVTYNLARSRYREGDLRAALAYLLQSEETSFSRAGKAAFEAALLLRNNVDRALEAAHRAETHLAQLTPVEQKDLLRYLVELYRRKGERETALDYVEKYRALAALP